MQPTLCARCKKNPAVIFITKMEGDKSTSEGICLKCARELGLKPVSDFMDKMGITDEDLDAMTNEMLSMFGDMDAGELAAISDDSVDDPDDSDPDGHTATFPFLNKLFGNMNQGLAPAGGDLPDEPQRPSRDGKDRRGPKDKKEVKRKFLENYCISLTQRAKEGKLDRIVGREQEIERVIQILNRRQKNNPCLIGEPALAKPRLPRASPCAWRRAKCRKNSRTRRFICLI